MKSGQYAICIRGWVQRDWRFTCQTPRTRHCLLVSPYATALAAASGPSGVGGRFASHWRPHMQTRTHGSCLCGAVSFYVDLPAKWVAHCHCSRCQRAHGAAFVTWVGFGASNVTVFNQKQALSWYCDVEASRGFCGNCGSPMFFKSSRYPGELHVARALFHEQLAQQPQVHVFFSSHVSWATLAGELPIEPEPEWSAVRSGTQQ